MKMVRALIRPFNLNEVKTALQKMGIDEIWTEEILVSQGESNGLKKKETLLFIVGSNW